MDTHPPTPTLDSDTEGSVSSLMRALETGSTREQNAEPQVQRIISEKLIG